MASEREIEEKTGEQSRLIADAALKTNNAIRTTAERYVSRTTATEAEKTIGENPLVAAALAAAVGFVIGGGMTSRPGLLILALVVRKALRETGVNFVIEMVRSRMS
jgi:ElaB/YqjD/DUF883 family membrane-anchored ribosome-binding protein